MPLDYKKIICYNTTISFLLTDLWNARIVEGTQGETVFKNLGWNQDIAAGESVSFGFTAQGAFPGFPEIRELPVSRQTVPESDHAITYEVTDAWDGGYNASLHILNTSDRTIEDWRISFDLPHEITDLWNGRIVSRKDDGYLVENENHHQNIAPGEEIVLLFTVNGGDSPEAPQNILLEELMLTAGTTPGGETKPGETGNGEVLLTVDTEAFDLNAAWETFLTAQRITRLSGTLQGAEKVEKLSYAITDLNGLTVSGGELEIAESWAAEDVGLVLGINFVTVTAVCARGETVEVQIDLMNFNPDNMEAADVDLSDTDGDGLNNYFETVLGTDPSLADTDGDGLGDLEEIIRTGTDPLKPDTDDDGIRDGQEDPDGDGLNNAEEIAAGTGALYPDTDGDGLSDGEEVSRYHTDPLAADTDGDGLLDGEDIRLGFDPLNPDTDGDGIPDGDEILYQTCTQRLESGGQAGITQVSVSMDCAGFIDNHVLILNVQNLDTRSSDVVGLFGAPMAVETDVEFDTATITFTYDEDELGETLPEDLRIMWYDEEEDRYVLLDDETVWDAENHTLSCSTTHFSKWMVVDRKIWWNAWKKDLEYRAASDDREFWFDAVWALNYTDCYPWKPTPMPGYEHIFYYSYFQEGVEYLDGDPNQKYIPGKVTDDFVFMPDREVMDLNLTQLSTEESKATEKILYFAQRKDMEYNAEFVHRANTNGIKLVFISDYNLGDNMRRMAAETGGKCFVIPTFNWINADDVMQDDIRALIESHRTIGNADSDGDGLYDIYETGGMRLSNGQVVRTDPAKYDTDGDGINDFLHVGGQPVEEKYLVDGEEVTVMVCRGGIYPKLSDEFVYVDGRINENGMVIDEKMEYVSYSQGFYKDKYVTSKTVKLFGDKRTAVGAAGVHKLFADKYEGPSKILKKLKYANLNSRLLGVIGLSSLDANAALCFYTYVNGNGGPHPGCQDGGTRKYIDASYMIRNVSFGLNSAQSCFEQNLTRAKLAAESVLNEYNTETYIALSPERQWSGCCYVDYADFELADPLQVLTNTAAFGIFNSADASITFHAAYDPATKRYKMEYDYYIVDFYDFSAYDLLCEEDALGIARSYELFGKCAGTCFWEKGKKGWNLY